MPVEIGKSPLARKRQLFRNQSLTGGMVRTVECVISVFLIPDDGMPDIGEMRADLMRLSRMKRYAQQ